MYIHITLRILYHITLSHIQTNHNMKILRAFSDRLECKIQTHRSKSPKNPVVLFIAVEKYIFVKIPYIPASQRKKKLQIWKL